MATVHEADLDGAGKKIAIVAGRFNEFVTKRLVSSAIECAAKHGMAAADVDVYWVPGSFEVPQMARRLAAEGCFDGIVCIGAIIRGETNHFDNLCSSVIFSIAEISSRFPVPVTYGIVSADTVEQALDRAGGRHGNKGWDAVLALIELMGLWKGEASRGKTP